MHCRRILKISQSRQDFFRGFVLAADENTFGHSDPSLFETARACAEHDPIWRLVRHKGQHSWTHCLGLEQIDHVLRHEPFKHARTGCRRKAIHANVILRTFKAERSEEHTSELQSLMRISYAVFCLKKKKYKNTQYKHTNRNYEHST